MFNGFAYPTTPNPILTPTDSTSTLNKTVDLMNRNSSLLGLALLPILIEQGVVNENQLASLQQQFLLSNQTEEQFLVENLHLSEEQLILAKSKLYNIPTISLTEVGISPEAINKVEEAVAKRYQLFPFSYDQTTHILSVAMVNPLDFNAVDFIAQKTGCKIQPYYATQSAIERAITERYTQNLSQEVSQAVNDGLKDSLQKKKDQELDDFAGGIVRSAPINKIVETILDLAVKARASDVHIEPLVNKTRVRYRIDGILVEKLILPKTVHEAVVSRLKIITNLKIDEKRVPQDGRFNYVSGSQEVDLRLSTLPTIHGEKIVMRLLKKDATAPTLEELGLSGLALAELKKAIKVPHGIILVTGPTGSGKTTTLYSVLHLINTPKVNIMTLEDPVEYQIAGVNQVQINPQAGLSFANGLRSFLRQDPNIIMVGEIRDGETAELAVQASLTGHLVFSTLHTNSASGALPRLMDMGIEPFLLASSMTLAMAQRVVRTINRQFAVEYHPDQKVMDDLQKVLGSKLDQWCQHNNKKLQDITLFKPSESRPDNEPEYKGRVGIFEVMPVTEEISKMIVDKRSAMDIEKVAVSNGMLLMKQDGYLKALDGITTIEEVLRVAEV